ELGIAELRAVDDVAAVLEQERRYRRDDAHAVGTGQGQNESLHRETLPGPQRGPCSTRKPSASRAKRPPAAACIQVQVRTRPPKAKKCTPASSTPASRARASARTSGSGPRVPARRASPEPR